MRALCVLVLLYAVPVGGCATPPRRAPASAPAETEEAPDPEQPGTPAEAVADPVAADPPAEAVVPLEAMLPEEPAPPARLPTPPAEPTAGAGSDTAAPARRPTRKRRRRGKRGPRPMAAAPARALPATRGAPPVPSPAPRATAAVPPRAAPPVPRAAATSPPGYGGPNPCRLAARGTSPIAQACQQGGTRAAEYAMKDLIKRAREQGLRLACDDCHADDDDRTRLTSDAREKLATLLQTTR